MQPPRPRPKTTSLPAWNPRPRAPASTSTSPAPTPKPATYPPPRAEFAHVLELAPTGSDAIAAHDEQAVLLEQTGNQAAALAEWRAGLDLLRQLGDQSYPERFYTGFLAITHHLALSHINLHPELEAVLRPYLTRSGNYRSNELLHAAYDASPTPADGMAFVVSLADSASDPDQVLRDLETASWLSEPQVETLLLRRLELNSSQALASRTAETSTDTSEPTPDTTEAATGKRAIQQKLAFLYLSTGNYASLSTLLDTIPASDRTGNTFRRAELLLAAHNNRLAAELLAATPTDTASLGLEPYTRSRRIPLHTLITTPLPRLLNSPTPSSSTSSFSTATRPPTPSAPPTSSPSPRLIYATNDLSGAVEILHRLALQPASPTFQTTPAGTSTADTTTTEPNANIDSAAALLESTHHPAEAIPFLQTLTVTVPWSAPYKLRLAEAQQAAGTSSTDALAAIAKDPTAPYATRAEAAEHLHSATPQDLGGAELNLLAQSNLDASAAAHPGYTTAQLYLAAQPATSVADRSTLLHQAIAAAPVGLSADRARLSLFLAEASASTPPADAIALRDLILQTPSASPTPDDTPDDTTPDATTPDTDATTPAPPAPAAAPSPADMTPATLPALALTLDLPTQIHLAETLSQLALTTDHNPQQAVAYLQLAITLDATGPAPAATLKPRLAILQAQIALDRLNTARRPVFHTDLTQKIAVRPRLTLAQAASLELQAKEAQ